MKIFHFTIILLITTNFSLYPMNIVSRKSNRLQGTRKIKQFLKINSLNNIASAGNIITAGLIGHPIFLLQMIPQMLHQTVTCLDEQKKSFPQLDQDLKLFIQTQPIILEHLDHIKKATQSIKFIEEKLIDSNLKEYYQPYMRVNKSTIVQEELELIQKISPLFESYKTIDISDYLDRKNYDLKLNKKIELLHEWATILSLISGIMGSVITLLPIIIHPSILNSFDTYTLFSASTISFSTGVAWKNALSKITIDKQLPNPEDTIKILEIWRTHLESKKNKLTQTNE